MHKHPLDDYFKERVMELLSMQKNTLEQEIQKLQKMKSDLSHECILKKDAIDTAEEARKKNSQLKKDVTKWKNKFQAEQNNVKNLRKELVDCVYENNTLKLSIKILSHCNFWHSFKKFMQLRKKGKI